MNYLLNDLMEFEKTAAWVQKLRLDKGVMDHEVNMRKHRLWEDAKDIELGIMQPKEKIKPKFRTMEKRRFNQYIEDSTRSDKRSDQMYDRQMRRQEVRRERNEAERKANEAKYKIQEQAIQKEWDQFFADAKKSESRRRVKPIAIAGAGAPALGGGAYLYNRYKKKKRAQAEQEKVAGESMPARYKKIDWANDPTGEKKKIKRKLLASGALTAAGLGVNLHQIALMARDRARNTNHAKPHLSMAGIAGSGAGLLLAEKQLQKAEHLDGLPVGGAANQKKSRFDDWNVVIY